MTLWVSGVFILSQSRQSGAEMYQKHLSWGTGCWLLSSEVFNEVDSQEPSERCRDVPKAPELGDWLLAAVQ
ncbi:unnamed protein product [Boreogadus saida]